MVTIYYHCLDMTPDDESFVADSLKELAQHLKEEPIRLKVCTKRLGNDPKLAEEVDRELAEHDDSSNTFSDRNAGIDFLFAKSGLSTTDCPAKLLVYCPSDNLIAHAAMKEQHSAVWGAAISPLAAVYSPGNKFIIWHEVVHLLLGLDECYEPYPPYPKKGDCDCESCLMQYAPSKETVGEWPSLCSKIIKLLQERGSKVRRTT